MPLVLGTTELKELQKPLSSIMHGSSLPRHMLRDLMGSYDVCTLKFLSLI